MNGPKIAAISVTVVILSTLGYFAWTSHQVSRASAQGNSASSFHVEEYNRMLHDVEREVSGRGR